MTNRAARTLIAPYTPEEEETIFTRTQGKIIDFDQKPYAPIEGIVKITSDTVSHFQKINETSAKEGTGNGLRAVPHTPTLKSQINAPLVYSRRNSMLT